MRIPLDYLAMLWLTALAGAAAILQTLRLFGLRSPQSESGGCAVSFNAHDET
jgi:hypothetical protein